MWIIVGLIVAFVLFYDVSLKAIYLFKAKRAGVRPVAMYLNWPLGIRNLYMFLKTTKNRTALEQTVVNFRKKKERTFAMEILGMMNVVTRDPENVKAILATDFKSFDLGLREPQLSYFLGSGIFTLSSHGWKHSRTLLRPQFTREQVAQIDSLRRHAASLEKILDKGEFVNIQHLFHQLTMDTATEFLFGESVDSLDNSQRVVNGVSAAEFVEAYTLCLRWSLFRIQFGPLYKLITSRKFRDSIARARRFVEYFVQQALDRPIDKNESSYVFTHELAKVTRDPVVIRDQAFNVLLAGRDTTASLLSYVLWHLSHNPEIYAKLREAVINEFGDESTEDVTFEGLKRCKYLLNVINETLRVNPTVPRNTRTATRDTVLPRGGGPNGDEPVFIPKGMPVVYSVYEIHRQPELWGPDAEEFRPDRWENHSSHGWEYLPFNGGPRICLGQQFALTEASFTVMRIAQKYERLELLDPTAPLVHDVSLTSMIDKGFMLKFHLAKAFQ